MCVLNMIPKTSQCWGASVSGQFLSTVQYFLKIFITLTAVIAILMYRRGFGWMFGPLSRCHLPSICPFAECVTVAVRPHNRLSKASLSQLADVNSSNASAVGAAAPLGTYTAVVELDHWGYAISGSIAGPLGSWEHSICLSVCLFLCVAGEAAIIESSLIFIFLFFLIFYLLLKVNKHINFDAIYIQKAVVVEIIFFLFKFPFCEICENN